MSALELRASGPHVIDGMTIKRRNVRGVRSPLPPNSVVGRFDGTGAAQVIDFGQLIQRLVATGAIPAPGPSGLASIADGRVLSNVTGSPATPTGNTLTAIMDHVFGATRGDILYRGAAAWVILGPGTSGFFLKTQGASADPVWAAGNAGTVTSIVAGTGLTGGTITSTGTIALDTPVTVPHGGTGDTSLAAHGVLIGAGTSPVNVTGAGTAGQVLTSNGASADPTFQAASGGATIGPNAGIWTDTGSYTKGSVVRFKAGYYIKVT